MQFLRHFSVIYNIKIKIGLIFILKIKLIILHFINSFKKFL